MELRRVRTSELAAVGELTVAAYAQHVTEEADYEKHLRDAARRDREAEVWVAAEPGPGGRLLGTVTICPEGSPWRERSRAGEGEFRMLAVDPSVQGRGVGRALVELALERFAADGCAAVVLSSDSSMAAAHRLYERLGFVRAPALDWSPVPGVDLLVYRKEL